MLRPNREIQFNIAFWVVYFLYEWFGLAALSGDYAKYFINSCMALPLSFTVSYLTVHWLIKEFYSRGEKLRFWTLQIVLSIGLLIVRRFINYYLVNPAYFPEARHVPLFSFGKLIIELVNLYLIVGVYALFYFVRSWYEERQRVQALEVEKKEAQLELLKSQVQPHFLFNALNNIYSTALKTSPETAVLVAHLSDFLNYSLYEAKKNRVPLTTELAHIRHYIELQRNRLGEKLDVSINIYDEINDLYLAPMLLLPLVENSFKHGVNDSIRAAWIRVDVSRAADHFSVKIENSVSERPSTPHSQPFRGIGLDNVQKRLALIYPGAHEFRTVCELHSFLVVLKVNTQK